MDQLTDQDTRVHAYTIIFTGIDSRLCQVVFERNGRNPWPLARTDDDQLALGHAIRAAIRSVAKAYGDGWASTYVVATRRGAATYLSEARRV